MNETLNREKTLTTNGFDRVPSMEYQRRKVDENFLRLCCEDFLREKCGLGKISLSLHDAVGFFWLLKTLEDVMRLVALNCHYLSKKLK